MESNILQQFLDVGLLDVGEDDARLAQLQAAADELAEALAKMPQDLIPSTLVALDHQIDPDDPVLNQVETVVKKHWAMLRNRFKDRPREVLRSVLIEALSQAADSDPDIAAIVWMTGRSYLPYSQLGPEKAICLDLLQRLGDLAEKTAVEAWNGHVEWTPPTSPSFELELPQTAAPGVDEEALHQELLAATGPNLGRSDQNTYWPHNQPQPWAQEFARRAATAIAASIDEVSDGWADHQAPIVKKLADELSTYVSSLNTIVDEAVRRIGSGDGNNERRTKLLWWKESMYSPSLKRSYRALEPVPMATAMAADMHLQVLPHCPESLEYFLRETVYVELERRSIDIREAHTLPEICGHLATNEGNGLDRVLGSALLEPRRIPLLVAVQAAVAGASPSAEDLRRYVGVPEDENIELAEFAVWLFRDLQASRLARTVGEDRDHEMSA